MYKKSVDAYNSYGIKTKTVDGDQSVTTNNPAKKVLGERNWYSKIIICYERLRGSKKKSLFETNLWS